MNAIDPEKSLILLEFNELCPTLVEQFMQAGLLPNFQRLYNESQIYTTDAEEEPPYLEPWIQWVTVHSGLPYQEHQIFNLDDGHKLTHPNIWDTLSAAGYRVWVCGSMNGRYQQPLNGYILPDYWSTQQVPYPNELWPFFNFVRRQVQEHTNDSVPLSHRDGVEFLRFMLGHGLSGSTVWAIAAQLVKEWRTGRYRWQRATILDKLQWDIFAWYYRRFRPHFSTFFINSTAHFQHMYWRNMQPERFEVQPSEDEQAEYETAILYGYQEMDKLIGKALDLADSQTTVMLCTALSQQPCLTYEAIGGKRIYRPRDFDKLLNLAGVTEPYTCTPVMAEEFFIRFETVEAAISAEQKLAALTLNQQPLMRLRRQGAEIYAGCGVFSQVPKDAIVEHSLGAIGFFEIFYQIEEVKSGMHHPDGILWIRQPTLEHSVELQRIPLSTLQTMLFQSLSTASSPASRVLETV